MGGAGEDGARDADAERERHDRDGGPARIPSSSRLPYRTSRATSTSSAMPTGQSKEDGADDAAA
jgi:hypothetical protein